MDIPSVWSNSFFVWCPAVIRPHVWWRSCGGRRCAGAEPESGDRSEAAELHLPAHLAAWDKPHELPTNGTHTSTLANVHKNTRHLLQRSSAEIRRPQRRTGSSPISQPKTLFYLAALTVFTLLTFNKCFLFAIFTHFYTRIKPLEVSHLVFKTVLIYKCRWETINMRNNPK